ncbi:MAG: cellulose biosynthesis cyclic di-GMP-binding regulatory protein BcsB [Anaerolineales bacterium]|nr:cellulose biosynthesis cyclic di-GMP-binding regulatory protein BcsB [Anaerolineales bacterium]
MRNLIALITVFVLMFSLFGNVPAANASTNAEGISAPANQEADNVFTFKDLGYSERIMVGPYDSIRIFFSTPINWRLTTGSKMLLKFNTSYSGANIGGSFVGGTLIVYFNGTILETVFLDQVGPVTLELDIPPAALVSNQGDGRHFINLFFDASINCDVEDVNSSVVIGEDSEISLQYLEVSPSLDLSRFPEQFYQPGALFGNATTIVVPDKPSVMELQSAIAVSASLGSVTNGQLPINLLPVGKLTDALRTNNNLIFVGLPSSFPILQNVDLPVPVTGNKLSVSGAAEDDGIIQLAMSPWKQMGVVMFVSGNTEAAVSKAGSMIGFDTIIPSSKSNVAVISNVNPNTSAIPIAETRTFAELGYDLTTLGDEGGQYFSYSFPISSEQASSTGAYLDLVTSHSNLLKLDQTGVSIFLNGQVVSSLEFQEGNEQITTTRIEILPNILRRGKNILEVVSDLRPNNDCASQELNGSWVAISEYSTLRVPVTDNTFDIGGSLDLQNFPEFFLSSDNLSELAFILSKDDTSAWNEASQLAYSLGNLGSVILPDLRVAYGDDIPEDVLNTRSLILIGRASQLPIIGELNELLPAPFLNGLDEAVQPTMLVNYRLLPGVSVGYIQVLPSPWNAEGAILAIMGNTDQGVPMAGQSLLSETLAPKLQGNFAIVYGDDLISTDTRLGPTKDGLAGQLPPEIVTTPEENLTPAAEENAIEQPSGEVEAGVNWILPVIVISTLLILIIVFVVMRRETKLKIVEKPEQE